MTKKRNLSGNRDFLVWIEPIDDPRYDYQVTIQRRSDGMTITDSVSGGWIIAEAAARRMIRELGGTNPPRTVSQRIRQLAHEGYPDGHGQAGAIAYREMRAGKLRQNPEYVPGPGKFESSGLIGELLYASLGIGGSDGSLGDETFGLYDLFTDVNTNQLRLMAHDAGLTEELKHAFRSGDITVPVHAIVSEDSQGFFEVTEYETAADARRQWRRLEAEYEKFTEESEESEEP